MTNDKSYFATTNQTSFFDRYSYKEKCDTLGGIIITRRYVIRVTIREQIYIIMKHKTLETMSCTAFRSD